MFGSPLVVLALHCSLLAEDGDEDRQRLTANDACDVRRECKDFSRTNSRFWERKWGGSNVVRVPSVNSRFSYDFR